MAVELTQQEEFAVLTLNRPDALNALNAQTTGEISDAIDAVERMDVRALIITGAGEKAFCAGADVKEMVGIDLISKKRKAERGQSTFAKLDQLRVPSVALINGYAFGGGLELALASTFRLATPRAAVALPEIKLGLMPGYGGTQRLPRIVGEARALEMIMTGRTVRAEEAQAIGLIHRLVSEDNRLAEAFAFAREFSKFSLVALGYAREAVQRALSTTLQDGLKIEAEISTLAFQSKDAQEGITAFIEKRTPNFTDA
ncbi:enoyl-CoA hydratase/isomerase family protein [Neorhizobium petrolearium]|uniref:Enoyl-CoA hydratase-related protein n=1 Tax=Neorhizobium petrolearium TaxID=515361 RepID=A0ABY8MCY0_9HYPH|nr:enoyl-CoA hydratase-related protein [Neorhizobium petrolearium]MCC2614618.1 enoyl-CoA hydratase/isomerase family protein [Neorhizobium petrolearium]WGI72370.1 enoyl-CoA hydratase-related protein [Neorhizobium petrolearium]